MFRWRDDAPAEARRTALEAVDRLADEIDGIVALRAGTDAGLHPGNHDLVVMVDLRDRAAFVAYAQHPAHLALIEAHLAPLTQDRVAIQHELSAETS
jgi:hypothetical protein